MSLWQSKAVHGAVGFLLMGGWAVFANRAYEMPAPLIAGAVQGLLTATITLFLKKVVEGIFHRSSNGQRINVIPSGKNIGQKTIGVSFIVVDNTVSKIKCVGCVG